MASNNVLDFKTSESHGITQFLDYYNYTWMIRAYLRAAILLFSSDLAPVHTILPDANISAVVFGSFSLMTTAANLRGLYSAFLA